MKRNGLGKGLDALLPQEEEVLGSVVRDISIDEIDTNASQPRQAFDQEALEQLADSIRAAGVLSPILVVEDGLRYRIVAGERRYRASRLAGMKTVPCIVRSMTNEEQMAAALIENVQRQDLNPMEEANAIQSLMKECGYTQEEAAQKLGKSRPAVANSLRLLSLPEEISSLVVTGELSAGHARVLCGIKETPRQLELASKCLTRGWSVRQLEEETKDKPAKQPKTVQDLTPELSRLQDRTREAFGLKTAFNGTEKKGKIVLSYSSADELQRFYDLIEQILQDG